MHARGQRILLHGQRERRVENGPAIDAAVLARALVRPRDAPEDEVDVLGKSDVARDPKAAFGPRGKGLP
jgi:hypothetical protein